MRSPRLPDPAVYQTEVEVGDVRVYTHRGGRHGEEFIVLLPPPAKIERIESLGRV